MAEPDNDPNASPDTQKPALPPTPLYQPPGNPVPAIHPPTKRNLSVPKQTPQQEFDHPSTPVVAPPPHSPPTTGPTPTALP